MMPETKDTNSSDGRIRGGRNLIIMGLGAIAIAIITTAISLIIYRTTGDIYLDCSRPGFVCRTEKKENGEEEKVETFAAEGEITTSVIDEYIRLYEKSTDYIYNSTDGFSPDAISNEALEIIDDVDDQPAEMFELTD